MHATAQLVQTKHANTAQQAEELPTKGAEAASRLETASASPPDSIIVPEETNEKKHTTCKQKRPGMPVGSHLESQMQKLMISHLGVPASKRGKWCFWVSGL